MTLGMTADEELEQYDDLDQYDDEPGFNLRDGGTDLFRAVLVLLIAAAVGALILTSGFDGASTTDDQERAADSVDADDTTDTGAVPASPATDGDGEATGDAAMADDAMTDDTVDGTATTTADGTAATAADSTASSADSTDPANTTTTLVASARAPGEVEVLVLNATDTKGIAAKASELLQGAQYNTAPAGNATISGMGSVIYYMDGYRADAVAVAQVFTDGLDGLVQAYDPAKPPSDEIGTANVIVVLGIDEAIPVG